MFSAPPFFVEFRADARYLASNWILRNLLNCFSKRISWLLRASRFSLFFFPRNDQIACDYAIQKFYYGAVEDNSISA